MTIFVGSDHNGIELKKEVIEYLNRSGYSVVDEGDNKLDPQDDFPVFASRVVTAMRSSNDLDSKGVLICGSGQGMCMAANRFKGIRASLCWNEKEARSARNDDDSNVLCLSAKSTTKKESELILNIWLNTAFAKAPRFVRRLKELDDLG